MKASYALSQSVVPSESQARVDLLTITTVGTGVLVQCIKDSSKQSLFSNKKDRH